MARPRARTSTPVAGGSGCRRARPGAARPGGCPTTSWEVIWADLSQTSTPSTAAPASYPTGALDTVSSATRAATAASASRSVVAGGVLVPAAAEAGGHLADVGGALGPQRDLVAAVGLLLEDGGHVAGAVGADQVDQALGLVHLDPVLGQVGQVDPGPDQRGLRDLGDAAEGVGDQSQVADAVGLEHGLGHLVLLDPGGQQLGRQQVGLGGGGLVLEAPVSVTSPV